MANTVYNQFRDQVLSGSDIWTSSTIYVLLVDSTSTYVPAQAHNHLSDFTGNGGVELSTSGYTTGGKQLLSLALARDDSNAVIRLSAASLIWTSLGAPPKTIKALLLYVNSGVSSTSDLIAYIDSVGPMFLDGSNVTLAWATTGIFTLA